MDAVSGKDVPNTDAVVSGGADDPTPVTRPRQGANGMHVGVDALCDS